MNTKADRPECECRVELREHEVRSNSVLTRNACGGGASAKRRSRHLRPHLPPSTNSAIIYKCVVMYFRAYATRIGA